MKSCSIGARVLCIQNSVHSFSAVESGRLVLKAEGVHHIFEAAKFPVSRPFVTSSNFFAKCPEKININTFRNYYRVKSSVFIFKNKDHPRT